ncbi:MAG: hypothetical protein LBT48_03865 [Prevotellaceae bacterium]|jgi:hypothetical protein|nr:hypothetical protein [Prevotellaceae bacterium]
MKTKYLYLALVPAMLWFASCRDKTANIQVTNKVHNVKLDYISYDGISLGTNVLPGETTDREISENTRISFPLSSQIQFYMVKGDSRVFLKTKEFYTLDAGQNLSVVISDTTEVVNISSE